MFVEEVVWKWWKGVCRGFFVLVGAHAPVFVEEVVWKWWKGVCREIFVLVGAHSSDHDGK